MVRLFSLLALCALFGCQETASSNLIVGESFPGRNPRLLLTNDNLELSYVTFPYGGDKSPISYSTHWIGGRFAVPVYLQEQEKAFINWADFSSARFEHHPDRSSFGFHHYLRYSADGTYDYDIVYSFWNDEVNQRDQLLHTDGVAAEHGFLSSAPLPNGNLQVTWLDGRYTKTAAGGDAGAGESPQEEQGADGHAHTGGAMTLRTRSLPDSGSIELDHRVCDCCNTATVATDDLTMVAYRDRSEHEIRDISYVVQPTGGDWSVPKTVHADNWHINGCPVNGPALAGNAAGQIAVAWYTAANETPRVQFARYDAANDRFAPPLLLDDANPLGRLSLALAADGTAYVSGLTTTPGRDSAALTLWTIAADDSVTRRALRQLAPGRSTGFPQLALLRDTLHFAYNLVGEATGEVRVETATLLR